MAGASPLGSDGVPHVFDSFTFLGSLDRDRWFSGEEDLEGRWFDVPSVADDPRREQLPLDLNVVAFAPPPN